MLKKEFFFPVAMYCSWWKHITCGLIIKYGIIISDVIKTLSPTFHVIRITRVAQLSRLLFFPNKL